MHRRVAIDTNVLVSRLLVPSSVPAQAARHALHTELLVMSSATLEELGEVLARAKFDPYVARADRVQYLRLIAAIAENVKITHPIRQCRDPKDDKFLDLLIEGKADVLITCDNDLLEMAPFRSKAIVTPRDYLRQL